MLTLENLKEFTNKNQTRLENIIREYIQHLFLSSLYKIKGSEKLLFKGGTALKIIYGSPRFSEDLDFDGQNIYQSKVIDDLFLKTISELEKTGIEIGLKEAKKTTGGYLGIINYRLYDISKEMKFEISLRNGGKADYEVTTIVSDYLPLYSIIHSPGKKIVQGKINALLDRGKPRDYYDIYFILRHPEFRRFINKNQLKRIEENLKKTEINFKRELSVLLPVSHQMILKDFEKTLSREIKKYL
ncbi:nucleotidyl transferase AbiEii/AbiGii toxin family protein [Patescibacteria group bacterium]|nr:nucleotidyl transferase AbiEii/AbiGii toxin family protein [Patescibacteria group bacterium]